jgi:phosphoglucomutase
LFAEKENSVLLSNRVIKEYDRWAEKATADPDLIQELKKMSQEQIEDSFYRNLEFGTGGLRGTIGAGTNRMNVYTVARATEGLAFYLKTLSAHPSVVIGYDSRIKSHLFAETAAAVFYANDIKVYMWDRLLPVPTVSFATRYLKSTAGVMITASHNPSKYNGYKVYGSDGCQITTEAAGNILNSINACDYFGQYIPNFEDDMVDYIPNEVLDAFIVDVKKQSVVAEEIDRNVAIVYTPLNGTGLEPVTRVLKETGFNSITVVKEQEDPDGNFPTCPYPNPEIRKAMELGIQYCENINADLLLATDPDCDRCGIAVKDKDGSYKLLSGNETGLLLFNFICSQRIANGTMPEHPVMIKTIVTSDMGEQIADHYGVRTINVLTGFKFIGEQIGLLEKEGKESDYIFGFEESYGYLTGGYVRDKDAVDASFMIAEMFAYYKTHGVSLLEKLDELYRTYGYRLNTLHSYEFDGESGFHKMQEIMKKFHAGVERLGGLKVQKVLDYSKGLDGLPKSDVLKYLLEGNSSVVVRPSGTEPKLKVYISISAESMEKAGEVEKQIAEQMSEYMY